ncbi:hypothetical protein [Enterobacter hormaechei]|uniref:hypothetical protein n=1 Tax=Enterobacter hormaechei TaxID=158836 RepID=UPI0034DD0685
MDVEATPAHRTAEVDSTRTMVERVERSSISHRNALSAIPLMAPPRCWLDGRRKDIEPHVPVWDKTERKDDSLSSNDFHWVRTPMNIAAQPANRYAVNGAPSPLKVAGN